MNMKAIVIEDERLSAESLISMLGAEYPDCEVIGVCSTVKEGISMLSDPSMKPDIIFADVRLSDGTCFAIFDRVPVDAAIVFTTAFNTYAMKAFEYYSAAYIVKPVMTEDLRPAVEKALKMIGTRDARGIHETAMDLSRDKPRTIRKLLLIKGDEYFLTPVEDICAIVLDGRRVKVYIDNGKYGYDSHNLRFFEENLDMSRFERMNRQTIVAVDKVTGGERLTEDTMLLRLKGDIPVRIVVPYDKFMALANTKR